MGADPSYSKITLCLIKTEDGHYIHDIWHLQRTTISSYHGICTTRDINGNENVWLAFRGLKAKLDEYEIDLKERNGRK